MYIPNSEIVRRRAARETTFFLTGATGFLGGHLAAELLKQGHKVILLARPAGQLSAAGRIRQMLDWFELDPCHLVRLRVAQGLLDSPRLGLSDEAYGGILSDVDEIIHCASDTSFLERKRESVEKANVAGMKHMLDFACGGRPYFFHYVSTVFAAGKRAGVCREEIDGNETFTNVYEETKSRAEKLAMAACKKNGLRLSIYRPSIVYGNSETGRSTRFNAVYYPVKTVLFMRDLYCRDIFERNGHKAAAMGVRLAPDGSLYMPIRVEVVENGGLNLIPVDHFIKAFTAILEERPDGGIFHIVNRKSKKIEDLVEYTRKIFNITGLETYCIEPSGTRERNPLETLFDKYLEVYGPYMRDTRTFFDGNANSVLAGKGIVCPDFDYENFSRCIGYAISCDWGSKLSNGHR